MTRCVSCGAEQPEGQRFCGSCGTSLVSPPEATRTSFGGNAPAPRPEPTASSRFIPGAMLGRRFRIVALLGRGGMGEVYRADDLKLGQPVALKLLPREVSADPDRRLIGDDEHGWGDDGVFNIEGGCYAKTIKLSAAGEPQIWNALRFGCVLENVPVDPLTRKPDFDSQQFTENTRGAYPVDFIPNCELSGVGGHPGT